jgi:hypothetical protein
MSYPDTERPLQRARIDGAAVFLQGDVCLTIKEAMLYSDLPPDLVPHPELEFRYKMFPQCSHASGAGGR